MTLEFGNLDGDAMLCDDYESFMMIVVMMVVER